MSPPASRMFTEADQQAFAALSGDWNPIHTDAVAARRTLFGEPIVHGVHGLLWALTVFGIRGELRRLEARFVNAIRLGATVECHVTAESTDGFNLAIRQDGTRAAIIRGAYTTGSSAFSIPRPGRVSRIPARLRFDQAAAMRGHVPLTLDPAAAEAILPGLGRALPAWQLAALLATTRIAGMECPGLLSVYSGLSLEFDMPEGDAEMSYEVAAVDDRFSLIEIDVRCPGARGTVRALFRPPSPVQPDFAQAAALVDSKEFNDWRALIVGGSRGLGEVAAKLVAAGGGAVCLTFHRGRADAEGVCAQLHAAGAEATAVQFDVTGDRFPLLPWPPTHLLYFATPPITAGRAGTFSAQKFDELYRCYVSGFERTVAGLEPPLAVLYPSTVFLDETTTNMAEYCAAKAAGEELCRHPGRAADGYRIHVPRLPRMLTDQTSSLMVMETSDPLMTILRELRVLAR